MSFEPEYLTQPGGKWDWVTQPRPIPFITRVRLSNYRSIRACDVTLGPLTVLVGPNGSGKSNFLDALSFLSDAISTTPEQALESRGGLRSICSRSPEPTDRFAIYVEAQIPWGPLEGQMPTASYGFELAANNTPGQRPFVIEREVCRIPWSTPWDPAGGLEGFEVTRGELTWQGSRPLPPSRIQTDRLWLLGASIQPNFSPLYGLLRNMAFYNFELAELRAREPESMSDRLGRHGEHLGNILGLLGERRPEAKERVQEYLGVVTSGLTAFDRRYEGSYVTVQMQANTRTDGAPVTFAAPEISDGTLHAAASLLAMYQPLALDGGIPLVGIEEPEGGLHPGAAGVLFDAMTEATGWVQVIATTHSGDLLDRKDFPVDAIRAVGSENGQTVIGPVDRPGLRALHERLFTAGELLRADQLMPEPSVSNRAASHDFDALEV